jgi:hypothetical protein
MALSTVVVSFPPLKLRKKLSLAWVNRSAFERSLPPDLIRGLARQRNGFMLNDRRTGPLYQFKTKARDVAGCGQTPLSGAVAW